MGYKSANGVRSNVVKASPTRGVIGLWAVRAEVRVARFLSLVVATTRRRRAEAVLLKNEVFACRGVGTSARLALHAQVVKAAEHRVGETRPQGRSTQRGAAAVPFRCPSCRVCAMQAEPLPQASPRVRRGNRGTVLGLLGSS
jgi:hypothetical protein